MDRIERYRIVHKTMNHYLTGRFQFRNGGFEAWRQEVPRLAILPGLWHTYLQELGLWQPGQPTPFPGYAKHPTQVELFTGVSASSLARFIWESLVLDYATGLDLLNPKENIPDRIDKVWELVKSAMSHPGSFSILKATGPEAGRVRDILENAKFEEKGAFVERIAKLAGMPSDIHRVMNMLRYYFLPYSVFPVEEYVYPLRKE